LGDRAKSHGKSENSIKLKKNKMAKENIQALKNQVFTLGGFNVE